uniref:Ig-like domain-containing protein n=1 Tax=Branchiostoma floridae TaxID=7739 RepID=C3YH72_BRAFL|eukprot:XP_002604297.1 hypothetical protein BRAFLDRAFT_88586 [Branchiostoma floridae]
MPPNLQDLSLQHQNITNIRVGDFQGLTVLADLRIQDSHVVHLQPGCFEGLTSLNKLDLRRNSIRQLEAETFKGLEQLRNLNLDHNEIYHIDNAAFPGLVKLRSLSINNNCLFGIPQDKKIVTGNISFTCQTVCQEGLKFSWIVSNGDHRSSSYEFSKNYTHVSKLSCKGSNITRLETKQMCYSVLNLTPMGNGTYTCKVTANHTQNASASAFYQDVTVSQDIVDMAQPDNITTKPSERSTRKYNPQQLSTVWDAMVPVNDNAVEKDTPNRPPTGLSSTTIIIAGLASFCGGCIIIAAIAACVYKFERIRQKDNGHRNAVNAAAGSGNDVHCLEADGGTVGSHYENDDQFSDTVADTGGDRGGQYENDDQFSDAGDRGGHYENDDQFSNAGDRGGHYENDDQFSNAGGARGGQYENDDQFSDAGDRGGHYENDDQFSNAGDRGGHYENDDQFSDGGGDRGGQYENDDLFSEIGTHHHENKGKFLNAGTEERQENDDQLSASTMGKSSQGTVPVRTPQTTCKSTIHVSRGHKREHLVKARALSSHPKAKLTPSMVAFHIKAQSCGHYDNETNVTSNEAQKTSANGESAATQQLPGHYDNDKNTEDYTARVSNATGDEEDSDPEYMTFPEARTEAGAREVDLQPERETKDKDTLSRSVSDSNMSDHSYMTFPGTDSAEDDNSDHTYVTFPGTDNTEDQSCVIPE